MKGTYQLTSRNPISPTKKLQKDNPICLVRSLLKMMEVRDPILVYHCERTAQYALALGYAVGLPAPELLHLQYAGLLHDLGQLSLTTQIAKGSDLTPDQDAVLQCHPRAGAAMLQPWPSLTTTAIFIAHHHERWDGYGYPYGLRGALIPMGARILTIADTFDNMVSPQPFGEGFQKEMVIQLLKGSSGIRFDPELVDTFIELIPQLLGGGYDLDRPMVAIGLGRQLTR